MLRPGSIEDLRATLRRPASLARPTRGRPEPGAIESLLGSVGLGGAGERWPVDAAGEPMAGLAQLNLTVAHERPR